MTTIDEPFICMIRSLAKSSGTTNSFKTYFHFANNIIDEYKKLN